MWFILLLVEWVGGGGVWNDYIGKLIICLFE